jgi:flagellar assembly protein FliH
MTNLSCNQTQTAAGIQDFVYQTISGTSALAGTPVDLNIFGSDRVGVPTRQAGTPNISDVELKMREAAAYALGAVEGRAAVQAEGNRAIAEGKEFVTESLKGFEQECKLYYRRMEGDIVELALAIARKVLHREAQVDRIVLAGVVRVALEKIGGSSQVTLHVHPTAVPAWQEYIAEQTVLATIPTIVEDGSLRPDQLVLKTNHGSTELGIEAQLKEIEKGFSDLVQQKQRSLKQ